MTTHPTQSDVSATSARDSFLRLVLKLDAVATAAAGLLSAAVSTILDNLLGIPLALLVSVGLFLLVYAAFVWRVGSRHRINRSAVQGAVAVNLIYAVGCLVLVAARPFPLTVWGITFILAQAAAVALFAALQLVGLRQSR